MRFNKDLSKETKVFSIPLTKMDSKCTKSDEMHIIGKQLLSSSASVDANLSAVTCACSEKEGFAKLSLGLAEARESIFWVERLAQSKLANHHQLKDLTKESVELIKIFSIIEKNKK
jgi:four helix bundle protein